LTFLVQNKDNLSDQLLVFFTDDESVGIKPIKKICERMISQSIMKGVLIYQKSMTPSALKVIQEMAPKYMLEVFQEGELLVNITKHILVPQHEVMSADEKATLLKR
jgi:DNA-directed RNA polymerases I, II, and III subunit RPABC1